MRRTRKYAVDATDDENLMPGTRGDATPEAQHIMRAIIDVTVKAYPGKHIMVVVMEPDRELFNYASNVQRPDMMAMLKALLKRLRHEVN